MTDEELRIAVESVRNSLTKSSLQWVLREVDETLRLGKPAVRTVLEVNEEPPDVLHLPSALMFGKLQRRQGRRSTVIPTTEAYSKKEELGLLLDAIQRTAIATADMQSYVVAKIARRGEPAVPERRITLERDGRASSTIPYENQAAAEVQMASLRNALSRRLSERAAFHVEDESEEQDACNEDHMSLCVTAVLCRGNLRIRGEFVHMHAEVGVRHVVLLQTLIGALGCMRPCDLTPNAH